MEINVVPKFVDAALGSPAKAVGDTLANIWNLGIGSHMDLWIKKQGFRQEQNLQDYISRVEEKTQSVPEEYIQDPSLHIVGPAIEASKYYIGSEELREMFANLIASSIDGRKSYKTHPSFVEIIKQLSPLDANVLMNFKDRQQIPLVQVRIEKETGEFITIFNHVMNFNGQELFKEHIISLSNLQRLGLIEIDYSIHSPDDASYEFVEKHLSFIEAKEQLIDIQRNDKDYFKVTYQKGLCSITPLCVDFIEVCL